MRIGNVEIENGRIRDAGYWDGMTVEELDVAANRFRAHRRELQRRAAKHVVGTTGQILAILVAVVAIYALPVWLLSVTMEPGDLRDYLQKGAVGLVTIIGVAWWSEREKGEPPREPSQEEPGFRDLIEAIEDDSSTLAYIARRRKDAPTDARPNRVGGGWEPGTKDSYPRVTE